LAFACTVSMVRHFMSTWFSHCVNTLGPESARFYFAQLKEACSVQQVESRGALMTKIFEDAAGQAKKPLHS
jgi:hypothetical protein